MNNRTHHFSPSIAKGHFLLLSLLTFLFFCTGIPAAQSQSSSDSKKFLPVVSVAYGMMSFSGDVGYEGLNQPLLAKSGMQIEVQKETDTRLAFSIFFLSGKVFGNEKTISRTVNFQSSILSEGIQVRYDFISKANKNQVLIPFISAGVEYIVFSPKADLKDADGNTYYYWKDGTIRSIDQSDPNSSQAVKLHRDYKYETELKDANLDGFGNFSESALGIPVGVGVRLKLSGRCSMHFSSVWHFTNTDLIDAVTAESVGSRAGDSKNDKFNYTSVSFRYDFSSPRAYSKKGKGSKYKPVIDVTNVDFDAIAKEDADLDGVPDIDDVEENPENVKVDATGKPIDTDGDGIADYRDQEMASAQQALVNENGVTITDSMIEQQFLRDSLAALPAIKEYLVSYDRLTAKDTVTVKTKPKDKHDLLAGSTKIPKEYRTVDTDFNGYITPQEISVAIDEYLAGKSSFTSEQFYTLIDYFFKQK